MSRTDDLADDLAGLGEAAFIDGLRRRGLARAGGVVRAIGDDAAVFRPEPGRVCLVTTDALVEGIHFRREHSSPEELGAKAIEVNVSDLAAMAARPREAVITLAAPSTLLADWLVRLAEGIESQARARDVNVLGGDTTASPGPVMIVVTLYGDAVEEAVIYRSGARPGDDLLLVGAVGEATAGLELLERGLPIEGDARAQVVSAFLRPRARVDEATVLAASGGLHAMIDVSDGLSIDLERICSESGGLGATLDAQALRGSTALQAVCRELELDPLDSQLGGGEDYALLCAVSGGRGASLATEIGGRFGCRAAVIGRIEPVPGLYLGGDGARRPLPARGHQHWR